MWLNAPNSTSTVKRREELNWVEMDLCTQKSIYKMIEVFSKPNLRKKHFAKWKSQLGLICWQQIAAIQKSRIFLLLKFIYPFKFIHLTLSKFTICFGLEMRQRNRIELKMLGKRKILNLSSLFKGFFCGSIWVKLESLNEPFESPRSRLASLLHTLTKKKHSFVKSNIIFVWNASTKPNVLHKKRANGERIWWSHENRVHMMCGFIVFIALWLWV